MFEPFGTITLFTMYTRNDGFTYAHITFESIEQASLAIQEMNKKKIEDKTLKVDFAVPNCVPKKKKKKNKGKTEKAPDTSKDFLNIGNKKSKKQMKQLKKEDKQLEYLNQVEEALKKIIELNN